MDDQEILLIFALGVYVLIAPFTQIVHEISPLELTDESLYNTDSLIEPGQDFVIDLSLKLTNAITQHKAVFIPLVVPEADPPAVVYTLFWVFFGALGIFSLADGTMFAIDKRRTCTIVRLNYKILIFMGAVLIILAVSALVGFKFV